MTNTSIGKISFSFIISALMLAGGLINISLSFNLAHATGAPTTNHVITGDTQKYRIFEGFAPTCNHQMLAWLPIQCQAHLSGGSFREN